MTKKERIQYLRIALSFCGITSNDCTTECIIDLHDEIMAKGEKFSLSDSIRIQAAVERRYKERPKPEFVKSKKTVKKR